jgi:hypothetical protein
VLAGGRRIRATSTTGPLSSISGASTTSSTARGCPLADVLPYTGLRSGTAIPSQFACPVLLPSPRREVREREQRRNELPAMRPCQAREP